MKLPPFNVRKCHRGQNDENKKIKDPWLRQLCIPPPNTSKCSTVHFHLSANWNKWRNGMKWGSSFTTLKNKPALYPRSSVGLRLSWASTLKTELQFLRALVLSPEKKNSLLLTLNLKWSTPPIRTNKTLFGVYFLSEMAFLKMSTQNFLEKTIPQRHLSAQNVTCDCDSWM